MTPFCALFPARSRPRSARVGARGEAKGVARARRRVYNYGLRGLLLAGYRMRCPGLSQLIRFRWSISQFSIRADAFRPERVPGLSLERGVRPPKSPDKNDCCRYFRGLRLAVMPGLAVHNVKTANRDILAYITVHRVIRIVSCLLSASCDILHLALDLVPIWRICFDAWAAHAVSPFRPVDCVWTPN